MRRGAAPDEVRARWLALVKQLHPDLGAGAGAAARLAEVNAAYHRLCQDGQGGRGPAARKDGEGGRGPAARKDGEGGRGPAARQDGPPAPAAFAVDDFRPVVFEAVLLAAVDVGDVTRTDEPFSLDMWVGGGSCHVELFPQAGGSVVSVDCANVNADQVAEALAAAIAAQGLGVTVS